MVQPLHTDEPSPVILDKTFIINNLKLIEQTREYLRYEIEATDINIQNLYKNVNYSNDKTQGKLSPYKIISDIMNKIRIFV
jgi:uncharacterized membrane protein YcaP (DUF421 family)